MIGNPTPIFFGVDQQSIAVQIGTIIIGSSLMREIGNIKNIFIGGNKGAIADQNLDAVISLLEVARRFSERLPGAKPALFIDQLLGEKILADSITASAQRNEVVQIMTVHSAI